MADRHQSYAQKLDEADELAAFRTMFVNADPTMIYMDGNSLGRLPKTTVSHMDQLIQGAWGTDLIQSWGTNWFDAPVRIGEKIAQLIGAGKGQVIVSDSTTVNLFKLTYSALMMRPNRSKIITDTLNFPSDLYMLQGCTQLLGNRHKIHMLDSSNGLWIDTQTVLNAIDTDTALITLSHVVFKSGYMYDIKTITEAAHQKGALVLWDLSHAVGAIPIELDQLEVDFAAGCTYKYLNGGPGAPAFLYISKRLQEEAVSPIWGWFGENKPFEFSLEYTPAAGIRRFLCGTPPILSLLAVESGVDILLQAGVPRLRQKSVLLTSYLIDLFDAILEPLGFQLGSPRNATERGSHVSVRHPDGYRISQALIKDMNLVPDFREPDSIRLGLAPLYTSFMDVWACVNRIQRVVEEGYYLRHSENRATVT